MFFFYIKNFLVFFNQIVCFSLVYLSVVCMCLSVNCCLTDGASDNAKVFSKISSAIYHHSMINIESAAER